MTDKDREIIGLSWLEIYESLQEATLDAGGVGFNLIDLKKMSVIELFNHIATNKVRFIYVGSKEKPRVETKGKEKKQHSYSDYGKRLEQCLKKVDDLD